MQFPVSDVFCALFPRVAALHVYARLPLQLGNRYAVSLAKIYLCILLMVYVLIKNTLRQQL